VSIIKPKKMSFHDNSFFEMKSMSTNINSTNNNNNISVNNSGQEYKNLNYVDQKYKVKHDKQYKKGSGTNNSKINNKNRRSSLLSNNSNFPCVNSTLGNNSLGFLVKKNSRTRSEPKVNLEYYWNEQENEEFKHDFDFLDIKEHKSSLDTIDKDFNLNKKLRGESNCIKNYHNSKIQEILDSPFNNIFFFEFEKRLKEYLQEHYAKK